METIHVWDYTLETEFCKNNKNLQNVIFKRDLYILTSKVRKILNKVNKLISYTDSPLKKFHLIKTIIVQGI